MYNRILKYNILGSLDIPCLDNFDNFLMDHSQQTLRCLAGRCMPCQMTFRTFQEKLYHQKKATDAASLVDLIQVSIEKW